MVSMSWGLILYVCMRSCSRVGCHFTKHMAAFATGLSVVLHDGGVCPPAGERGVGLP